MNPTLFLLILFTVGFAQDICDNETCQLPNCECYGSTPPGGLTSEEVPQIVWITFDDAMTTEAIIYYKTILEERQNPNGCNITMTFFLNQEYTNYSAVHELWRFGSEFASNSISKIANTTYLRTASAEQWEDEMLGMKEIISTYALIPLYDIQGMRAPYYTMGGDNMFTMASNNFTYDSSWFSDDVYDPIYPYTLDFNNIGVNQTQDCAIGICPQNQYPGLWEYPSTDMIGYNNTLCGTVCACEQPGSQEGVYEFFMRNFYIHYNSSRAPLVLNLSVGWFQADQGSPAYNLPGFLQFLDAIGDTYVVNGIQTLNWMRNPESLDAFSCPAEISSNDCESYTCYYPTTPTVDGGPRTMVSCVPCPPSYPWVGNVDGNV